jgi:hypothetical protein
MSPSSTKRPTQWTFRVLLGSGRARLRLPDRRGYSPLMSIEPPDPLRILAALRVQLEQVAALVNEKPDRAEYAAALDRVAGAAVLLERGARLEGVKAQR